MNLVPKMPFQEYLKHPALGNSDLAHLADCPAAFKYFQDNPNTDTDTPDRIEGTALHLAFESIDLFRATVVRADTKTTAKKGENGTIELGWERYDRVLIQAQNLRQDPDVQRIMRKGVHEVSVFTTLDGVEVKSRPDFLPHHLPIITDLKSTRKKPTPRNMRTEAVRWRYYVQAPYYLDQQPERKAFVFVFSHKEPPYIPALYEPDQYSLDLGRQEYQKQLETFKRCTEMGIWPGYGINKLEIPKCVAEE